MSRRLLAVMIAVLFFVPLVPATAINMDLRSVDVERYMADLDTKDLDLMGPRATYPVEVTDTGVIDATGFNNGRNIVRDDDGTIHVVFPDNNEIWYTHSKDDGATWSTPVNVSNDTGSFDSLTPAIACNGSMVYIVWADITGAPGDNEYVRLRRTGDNGTTWDPARTGAGRTVYQGQIRPFDPDVASNKETDVYVVWMMNEDSGEPGRDEDVIYHRSSSNGGVNFAGIIQLSDTSFMSKRATVEAEAERVLVVWHGETSQNWNDDDEIWWALSLNAGGAWTGPQRITFNNVGDMNPTAIVHDTDISIVWQTWNGNDWDIVYKNSTDQGTNWNPGAMSDPAILHDGATNSISPTLAQNGDELYCMWESNEPGIGGNLMMSDLSPDHNWTKPLGLHYDGTSHRWPSLKVNASDGIVEWVWTNRTSAPYHVLYDYINIVGRPVLDWTGETGYTADAVQPDSGYTGETYTFRINYTDPDNDPPAAGYPSMLLDKNMNNMFDLPDERFTLDEENAADTTYTDGKVYLLETRFTMSGMSRYVFEAWDDAKAKAGGPGTLVTMGPNILDVNEAPILEFTEQSGYVTDAMEPEAGTPATEFEFRIVYRDILNESPAAGFPKIYLDLNYDGDFDDPEDENHTMAGMTDQDTTYWNGKIYTYERTFLPNPSGHNYSYYIYVEDVVGLTDITDVLPGPLVSWEGARPVLSVTGEDGYTTDGVSPDTGYDTSEFSFRVLYSDADGDMPAVGHPTIGIDLNRDGDITPSEKSPMVEVDTNDLDTTDGKIFQYDVTLGAEGVYSYQFDALDLGLAPADALVFDGPTVSGINTPPVLKYMGLPGYDTDGLEPENGFANYTDFVYKVIYEDVEGNMPMAGYPKIWVDLNIDGKENASEWFLMEDLDPADTDVTDGKTYTYVTKLSTIGLHNYRFVAKDIGGGVATGSPTLLMNGPMVTPRSNMPPALLWVGTGDYNDTGIIPAVGYLAFEFVYKVKYIDIDGDMPAEGWPKVYIDEEGDGLYNGSLDIVATMVEENVNDTNVGDGKVYYYNTTLPVMGNNYTYMFKAEDEHGAVADASGSLHGMVFLGPEVIMNEDPLLKFVGAAGFVNDAVEPDSGPEGTEFTFRVLYKDTENEAPLNGKVYVMLDVDADGDIDGDDLKKEMTEVDPADVNYSLGKEYSVTHTFDDPGTFGYLFTANDIVGNPAGGPASGYTSGPVVTEVLPNRDPELLFTGEINYVYDAVHPFSDVKGAKFTFRVKYIDPDNDPPASGEPILTIGDKEVAMTPADATDTDYQDGKIYYAGVILDEVKEYTYSFSVKNDQNQTATLGPFNGPVVVKKGSGDTPDGKEQFLEDYMWLIVVILAAVICALIGYTMAKPKTRVMPQPQRRRYEEPETYDEEEPPDEEPAYEPEETYEPEPEPMPEPEAPVEEDAVGGADLAAGAEQPAESGEEVHEPAPEEPGPPAEEPRADLDSKQDETEAPAEDTEPGTEPKKDVEEDIDDILAKLSDGES